MAENSNTFPYLIPLIWQGDGPNPSPNYTARYNLCLTTGGGGGIPRANWGGRLHVVGGGAGVINSYTNAYNTIVASPSPMEIDVSFQRTGTTLNASATVNMLQNITATNVRIVFILTYNFDATQTGNYFSSVVRYNEQNFTLTSAGQTQTFSQEIALNTAWDRNLTNLVVFVQNFSGNIEIFQAASVPLVYPGPVNVVSYSSENQITLKWDRPNNEMEIFGYTVYRNNQPLNANLLQVTHFTDNNITAGTTYNYTITAMYAEGEESKVSEAVTFTPIVGVAQLGSGTALNQQNQPGPININNRSLRGQFIYTADELLSAGIEGGPIFSIAFNVIASPQPLPNFNIRVKHTDLDSPTEHDDGPWTTTLVIPEYQPHLGIWDRKYFETPFVWDGESNIIFDTGFDLVATNSAIGQVSVISETNGYRHTVSNTESVLNAATTDFENFKPQLRLGLEPFNPAGREPLGLSGTKMTFPRLAVNLRWSAPIYTETPIVGYQIFRDGSLIQTTVHPNFIDINISEEVISYNYYVKAVHTDGISNPSDEITVIINVSEQDEIIIPKATKLGNNYPNPFNPSTTIVFELSENTHANIEIFNIKGQHVTTLLDRHLQVGRHTVNWDGNDSGGNPVSAGIYLYQLKTDNHTEIKRMVMVK
jgi:hypothetical protein